MMCSARVWLILSIIAAKVVDLPLPVGPVTSTRPRGRETRAAAAGGRPIWSSDGADSGMTRKTAPTEPFCMNRLPRKRASPSTPKEKSSSFSSSKSFFCCSVSTL